MRSGNTRNGKRKNRKSTVTVEGVVALAEDSDWGDDDELVILTDDDEEYYIDSRSSAIRADKYSDQRVEATGRLYEWEGRTMLALSRIRIVDDYGEGLIFGAQGLETFDDEGNLEVWNDDMFIDQFSRYRKHYDDLLD
jgi:hypothetical protein